jgi:DUF1680 family protein
VAVHHYVNSEARARDVTLNVTTGFPYSGRSVVKVQANQPAELTLWFRVPSWSHGTEIRVNGAEVTPAAVEGYLPIRRRWAGGDEVELQFSMAARQQFARPEIEADRGRLALSRGPLVYCLEQADNGPDLEGVTVPLGAEFQVVERPDLLGGTIVLTGPGSREEVRTEHLYTDRPPAIERVTLTAVPYYAWGNREPGEMQVWVRYCAS